MTARLTAATAAVVALAACATETPRARPTATPTPSAAAVPAKVIVEDAWVRATTGTKDRSMTAAFMTLTNPGEKAVVLTSATSPVAGMVHLHEMAKAGGRTVMREKAGGISVAAGSHQHLRPGGLHVMLMDLKRPLKAGDEVAVTLAFSDGTKQALTVPVKKFTEEEEHYHPSPSKTPARQ
jgi:copper(I)-binding protein